MTATKQPIWKTIANLGDVHPLEYGGYFVNVDETGVYAPEAELLTVSDHAEEWYYVHRFILEPCTFIDGILSDNRCHPNLSAWFADVEGPRRISRLISLADSNGIETQELIRLFCSNDSIERAHAYRMVGEYHGFENLDSYPLRLTREEVEARYKAVTL